VESAEATARARSIVVTRIAAAKESAVVTRIAAVKVNVAAANGVVETVVVNGVVETVVVNGVEIAVVTAVGEVKDGAVMDVVAAGDLITATVVATVVVQVGDMIMVMHQRRSSTPSQFLFQHHTSTQFQSQSADHPLVDQLDLHLQIPKATVFR
jgi:hypothetical protein